MLFLLLFSLSMLGSVAGNLSLLLVTKLLHWYCCRLCIKPSQFHQSSTFTTCIHILRMFSDLPLHPCCFYWQNFAKYQQHEEIQPIRRPTRIYSRKLFVIDYEYEFGSERTGECIRVNGGCRVLCNLRNGPQPKPIQLQLG